MRSRPLTSATGLVAGLVGGLVGVATAVPVVATPAPAQAATPAGAAVAAERADPRGGPFRAPKVPTSVGYGGAVSTVDPVASRVALGVLRRGGSAADAAVVAAATLGVTEPYSAGIGGGGYFVHYDAQTRRVTTIDGRETAPAGIRRDAFIDPATGQPYRFTPELVTSGVSVGVPGTPATWATALRRWGTLSLRAALRPAAQVARRGFVVDATFRRQTLDNEPRFAAFTSTRRLFLPGGDAPRVGSTFRNPDLAATYELLGRRGARAFYTGRLAGQVAGAVRNPPTVRGTDLPVPPGSMTRRDLRDYRVRVQPATRVDYRGFTVHGMRPSSSGGSTVGEALGVLERSDLGSLDPVAALHRYLEASALAFADRGRYLGDAAFVDVPLGALLDPRYAAERACLLDPDRAATKPVPAGDVGDYDGVCGGATGAREQAEDTEGVSTTHLTVVDRTGDVVTYTLTIEQTGGSGIVVPGRGFLLNNELTDFSLVYAEADPNRIQPRKRPRSSMSPTLVLRDGRPVLALGSPGGSTIITTVLQVLLNRLDLGMTLPEAVAAPRASQRNTASVTAEPEFITAFGEALEAYGHTLAPSGDAFTSAAEIGAATAVEIGPGRRLTAVAEPRRRGGGSALVVYPAKRGG